MEKRREEKRRLHKPASSNSFCVITSRSQPGHLVLPSFRCMNVMRLRLEQQNMKEGSMKWRKRYMIAWWYTHTMRGDTQMGQRSFSNFHPLLSSSDVLCTAIALSFFWGLAAIFAFSVVNEWKGRFTEVQDWLAHTFKSKLEYLLRPWKSWCGAFAGYA